MRRSLYAIAALLLGAMLATALLVDPGYIAFAVPGHLLTISLPAFVLLLVLAYFIARFLWRAVQARRDAAKLKLERQRERARRQLARGLIELSEGNWNEAEQTLTRAAREGDVPVVHYLAAARAAELLGETARRDEWLTRALDAAPEHRAAVLITQAEMYLKHNQLKAALATLEQLDASGHQNARGLVLMARIHRQLGDWRQLAALESRLRAGSALPTALADELVAQIYLDRLKSCGQAGDAEALNEAWKDVPKSLAKRADVITVYARAAMACRQYEHAQSALRELLDEQWDEGAAAAFGELEPADALEALQLAERWLTQRPKDAVLLTACARLSLRNELYGKARSYLEASVAIRPRLETYQLLANLLEQLGDREGATKILNDALVFAVGRKANLPRVRALRALERRRGQDRRG